MTENSQPRSTDQLIPTIAGIILVIAVILLFILWQNTNGDLNNAERDGTAVAGESQARLELLQTATLVVNDAILAQESAQAEATEAVEDALLSASLVQTANSARYLAETAQANAVIAQVTAESNAQEASDNQATAEGLQLDAENAQATAEELQLNAENAQATAEHDYAVGLTQVAEANHQISTQVALADMAQQTAESALAVERIVTVEVIVTATPDPNATEAVRIITATPHTEATLEPTIMPTMTLVPTTTASQVVIAQVVGAGDIATEGVEILNTGNAINISGWTLVDSDGNEFVFPDGRRLFNNAFVTVFTRSGENTPITLYWEQDTAMYESGETLILYDADGEAQATFTVP